MKGLSGFRDASLDEVGERVLHLSQAETREVSVQGLPTPQYMGIWNTSKDVLESIQSKDYRLVQHGEAFSPIVETLQMAGYKNAKTRIYEGNGKAVMTLLFPEIKVVPKDGNELMLGFMAKNSYNGSLAVSIEGYGFRGICSNGMILGKSLLGSFREIHMGRQHSTIRTSIHAFMEEIATRIPRVKTAIDMAIEEELTPELAKIVLEKVGFGTRRVEQFAEVYNQTQEPSRFGLYNAVTYFASHDATSEATARRYELMAQKILTTPLARFKDGE
jgi:hypothetical protein